LLRRGQYRPTHSANNDYDKAMLNTQNIKFRIIALGIALLLCSLIVRLLVALPLFEDHVRELAINQQTSVANYVARDVDDNITSHLALIGRFAAALPPELATQPEQLQLWIKDQQTINPTFNGGLLALHPDGRGLIAEYPTVPGRGQFDYSAADWLHAALRSNDPVLGKPMRGRISGDPLIVFAAPVRDASGNVVTVLAGIALLGTVDFLKSIQETRLGETGGFLLISPADKLFLASSDPDMILQPTPPPGVNLLHDRAMSGYRGSGITVNAEGVEELSVMVTVPSTGWFVVARMPTEEVFRPIGAVRTFMLKASAAFLIVILVILLTALPRILRPLTDAARAIRAMADGKTRLAPLPLVRDDEVGKLVSGFNFLVEKLRQEETAREVSEAKLKFMAHHDSLTGLYNRAMLEDHLEKALACTERDDSQIALLFCDLDGFKAINDQHGHEVGDSVLRQVALRLTEGRRRSDFVARLGGDEFVILLTGVDDARAAAHVVAGQCLSAFGEAFDVSGKTLSLGLSIGIALHAGTAVTPSYLIAQADIAMYQAKRKGKGKYFFMEEISADKLAAMPVVQPVAE
jgi:diguanylate cyclase (GGDEF)-like protein